MPVSAFSLSTRARKRWKPLAARLPLARLNAQRESPARCRYAEGHAHPAAISQHVVDAIRPDRARHDADALRQPARRKCRWRCSPRGRARGAPQPAVRRGFQFHGRVGGDQVGTAGTGLDGSLIPSNQMRANCMPRSDISMPPDRAYRAGPTARNRS